MAMNASGVSFARGRIQQSFLPDWNRPVRGYICKVPHGATVIDWWGVVATTPTRTAAAHSMVIGFADANISDSTITHTLMAANTSISVSTVIGRFTAIQAVEGYALTISVSDEQQNQYAYLVMHITQSSASFTLSISFYGDITVMYTMEKTISTAGLITE
jgi:hypothetical protein